MSKDPPAFEFDFGEKALEGRPILVVGGSGGLGSAVVTLLVREGARVIVGYRSDREKAERLRRFLSSRYDRSIELVEGDIASREVRKRYLDVGWRDGPLYGLVCMSGNPARVRFDEASLADLSDSFQENYSGPVLMARDVAAEMKKEASEGAIVLFSTMQATALFASSINYAAPKASLIHAARIMAKQWGGRNEVRVNVIAPGVNRAGMALKSIASGKYDVFVDEGIIPRFGRAEDIARTVRFLLQPDNYITGQVITVDGGLTIRM